MTDDTIHIISNEFSRGIGQSLEWWKYRLSLYEHYTLNSLVNQTNNNFYLVMTIDDRFPLVTELKKLLEQSGLKYIITNRSLENDLASKIKYLPDSKYVFATRIDSDDLFRNDVVEEIQEYEYKHRGALVFQKGYCYNCVDKKLQHYKVLSPPNSTIMYPREIFIDVNKTREYLDIHGHDQVFSRMKSTILFEDKYMILIHKHNRRSIYIEGEQAEDLERYNIPEEEHEQILKKFGINNNTNNKLWKE